MYSIARPTMLVTMLSMTVVAIANEIRYFTDTAAMPRKAPFTQNGQSRN